MGVGHGIQLTVRQGGSTRTVDMEVIDIGHAPS